MALVIVFFSEVAILKEYELILNIHNFI